MNTRQEIWRRMNIWFGLACLFTTIAVGTVAPIPTRAETPGTAVLGLPEDLTDMERATIRKENDPRDHVEACLKIGGTRLTIAQDATQHQAFDEADRMMLAYDKLILYTNQYARAAQLKDKRRDQMYRTFETTLRHQMGTLETISRQTPGERPAHAALQHAKEIRRQLLNSVFGGDFLKSNDVAGNN